MSISGPETTQTAFHKSFSKVYDIIYAQKEYERECDYIEALFSKYSQRKVLTLLDTAAGTGNHAIRFANRGYQVTASDLSNEMISVAQEKAMAQECKNITFKGGVPMQQFSFEKKYDAIVCLFASINYVFEFKDLMSYLNKVTASLEPGGIFVCDFWNGYAVVNQHTKSKQRRFDKPGASGTYVNRESSHDLDLIQHASHVRMKTSFVENNVPINTTEEDHFLRFYYPQEMKNYVTTAGLEVVSLHPFLEGESTVTTDDWNVTLVAVKPKER
jgi:ubiquinone/menaquinone biosynthesis C-methylase UbiE